MKESKIRTKSKPFLGSNWGGFSWKRLLGISAYKAKISRKIGVPLTHSGRQRKLGAWVEKMILALVALIASFIYALFHR